MSRRLMFKKPHITNFTRAQGGKLVAMNISERLNMSYIFILLLNDSFELEVRVIFLKI